MKPADGAVKDSCQAKISLSQLGQEAIEAIEGALCSQLAEILYPCGAAQRALVRLRDQLIECYRQESETSAAPRSGDALARVNTALSLVTATEFPSTGIRLTPLDQAKGIIKELLEQGM